MPGFVGQSTDAVSPGVTGTALSISAPGVPAIGVKGDGGSGFPPVPNPSPGLPPIIPGRRATGVLGVSADPFGAGVEGQNTALPAHGFLGGKDPQFTQFAGVYGESAQQGVIGLTTEPKGTGVYGGGRSSANGDQIGVRGETMTGIGVNGHSFGTGSGVVGRSDSGIGVLGTGGRLAARFEGDVEVTGDIRLVNADVAEDFSILGTEQPEPGTVMVLNDEGSLQQSRGAYDRRVAGVLSGAGEYRPALVLDKRESSEQRLPVALVGKTFCKVDAQYSSIEVGDLLTTSPTPGHAMKAADPTKAFGAVIGKALRPLAAGTGMIPILIALQ